MSYMRRTVSISPDNKGLNNESLNNTRTVQLGETRFSTSGTGVSLHKVPAIRLANGAVFTGSCHATALLAAEASLVINKVALLISNKIQRGYLDGNNKFHESKYE